MMILATLSASPVSLKDAVLGQITSFIVLVNDAVMRTLRHTSQIMESSRDVVAIPVFRTVIDRVVSKKLQRAAHQYAVE